MLVRHMVSRLPEELLDHILEHLRDDSASLNACSLVSNRWVYPAQRLLLFQLSVSLGSWYFGIPTVLVVLKDYTRVIHHAKVLKFRICKGFKLLCDGTEHRFCLDAPIVLDILSVMTNVHTLIFDGLQLLGKVPWGISPAFRHGAQPQPDQLRIKQLVIKDCEVFLDGHSRSCNKDPISEIVSLFRCIEELSIGGVFSPDPMDTHNQCCPALANPILVRSLTVELKRWSVMAWVASRFAHILNTCNITSLRFVCSRVVDATIINDLLPHVPNVRILHVDVEHTFERAFNYSQFAQSEWATLDLSPCRSLQSLQIEFGMNTSTVTGGNGSPIWDVILKIISTTASSISSLSLTGRFFSPKYERILDGINWSYLRAILEGFPRLGSLYLDVLRAPGQFGSQQTGERIKKELEWFYERGILIIPGDHD